MRAQARQRLYSSLRTLPFAFALALSLATTFAAPASAADSPGPVVWYRASEECPSGAEFLGKLSGRASGARLAQAGDHMDFVVTLVAASGETSGRLERQTKNGTVAIRELRDASCLRVADALAFSLTLALQPSESATTGSEAPAASPPVESKASQPSASDNTPEQPPSASPTARPQAGLAAPSPTAPDKAKDAPPPEIASAKSSDWWLGAQGGAITGMAPDPLARAAVFLDHEHALPSLTSRFSFRLAAVGVVGSSSTEVGSVPRWNLGGRVEGCPWSWGDTASLRPCLAVELGATAARGTRSSGSADVAVWAAPGAALRGALAVASRLRFEAEAGALFPLLQNDVYAGSEVLYRAQIASFHGALGLALALP